MMFWVQQTFWDMTPEKKKADSQKKMWKDFAKQDRCNPS
jgi:hypothetical protein